MEAIALVLTGVVHLIGAAVLVWALMDGEDLDVRGLLRPGDGGVGPRPSEPPRGGPPLADARPSATRLREPGRLADHHPRPGRRRHQVTGPVRTPEHESV